MASSIETKVKEYSLDYILRIKDLFAKENNRILNNGEKFVEAKLWTFNDPEVAKFLKDTNVTSRCNKEELFSNNCSVVGWEKICNIKVTNIVSDNLSHGTLVNLYANVISQALHEIHLDNNLEIVIPNDVERLFKQNYIFENLGIDKSEVLNIRIKQLELQRKKLLRERGTLEEKKHKKVPKKKANKKRGK